MFVFLLTIAIICYTEYDLMMYFVFSFCKTSFMKTAMLLTTFTKYQEYTPQAQHKQGKVIGVGVHIYITEKPFTSNEKRRCRDG